MKTLLVLVLLSVCSIAQKTESVGKVDAPQGVASNVQDHGMRVLGKDGAPLVSIWPAKSVTTATKQVEGANYPQLEVGGFAGVIRFEQDGKDFRGQTIPQGTYTLRYDLLPNDGNHMGVAPNRDFLLLLPLVSDPDPSLGFSERQLLRASAKLTGGTHPAVLSLVADEGESGKVTTNSDGFVVVHLDLVSSSGSFAIALVVKGVAHQ